MRPHPHLYEINTWPWLEALSRRAGRALTLADVPAGEWDALAARGIDLVYLMGVWKRSGIGRQIARGEPSLFEAYDRGLPGWRVEDVVGSAFSITGYEPDPRIAGPDDLARVRAALHARGMSLVLDFVPNHTGFDDPWIQAHPDRYVRGTEAAFRREPRAFRPVELPSGDVRLIACGRDPFFPPWTDVAQLNYANPETRDAMVAELRRVSEIADGVRCDMAMLVLSDVFTRTWGTLAGGAPDREFWADAIRAVPDLLLIAEVYWDLEWRLQQLGFAFTYDKRLYDRLLDGSTGDLRTHLRAGTAYQNRLARFIENHDEPRSAAAFGDRVRAAAVTMSTIPGLRFFHGGQLEGRRLPLPVQLGRAAEEPADAALASFYDRLLGAANEPVFHDGDWTLLDVQPAGDATSGQVVAWAWTLGHERRIVAVNLGARVAQARIAADVGPAPGDPIVFEDLLDGREYPWTRRELAESGGLYVKIGGGCAHLFRVR